MLTHAEYQETFDRSVEKTFEEMHEDLTYLLKSVVASEQCRSTGKTTGRLPTLSLMERIEKLGGDYDIQ